MSSSVANFVPLKYVVENNKPANGCNQARDPFELAVEMIAFAALAILIIGSVLLVPGLVCEIVALATAGFMIAGVGALFLMVFGSISCSH